MKKYKVKYNHISHLLFYILFIILLFSTGDCIAQNVKVLPSNGSSSNEYSPQGFFRYQRQFYLIPAEEMSETDLQSGWDIESMGFTIASPQDTSTKGGFKVYLQNTTDTISRLDTAWTYDTILVNNYLVDGLFPGDYEWQVKALCTGGSMFSDKVNFSNSDLPDCTQPDSLYTTDITETSAILHWNSMNSPGFSHFLVEYRLSDESSWTSDTTSNTSYELTGLDADQSYIWRVRTNCTAENSLSAGSSFHTTYNVACDPPADLAYVTVTDTSVELSWTAANNASYYEINFRRTGTSFWYSTISVSNTLLIQFGLVAGTEYEWQIRTVCSAGNGAFIVGPSFSTTGDPVCYPPTNLMTTSISDESAIFSWSSVSGATKYVVGYRLKGTISWSHAIGTMVCVHNDSLEIPDSIGAFFVSFVGGSSFTYNGDGLYIAFEHTDSAGYKSTLNTALCNKQNSDTLSFAVELNQADTQHTEVLNLTNLRPETWLGSSELKDSVEVETVHALGFNVIPYGNPSEVMAIIKNLSSQLQSYTVTLTVKEQATQAVKYSSDQIISVAANSSDTVSFTDWFPTEMGTDLLVISIPAQGDENLLDNNEKSYVQNVNPYLISHADGSDALAKASIGFGSGEGLILNRHSMNGCGKVIAVHVYLDWSAIGNTVYAVVLDESGTVLDTTVHVTPDTADVNKYHNFYFATPPDLTNEDYFVGLAQLTGTEAFYPVGVQWEGIHLRTDAFYRANLDGSNISDTAASARPMIRAEMTPSNPVPFIQGDEILCTGSSAILEAGSRSMRYANEVIDFSSQFSEQAFSASKTLGVENVYPENILSSEVWIPETSDDSREYLVLGFPDPAPINSIQIFEVSNPGAIDSVLVKDPGTGTYEIIYADSAYSIGDFARIFTIEFPETSFDVSEIRIAINDTAVAGFNAIDAVAIGQTHVPGLFDDFLWSPGGETTSSITITEEDTYELDVTTSSCSATTSIDISTPVVIVPEITAGGPTTFCEGENVWLFSNQAGDNSWSTGATTDSILVDTSGSYTVTYDDGCVQSTSNPVVVTVNPLPNVIIGGGVICLGESAVLDAGAGYDTYAWSTGESSQTITVSSPALFMVTVTDANGCVGSASIVPTLHIPPSPHITGELGFCPGDTTLLDAGSGYSEYLWSTMETTQTIEVSNAGPVDVTVTDANGCTGSDQVTAIEYDAPEPFIAGSLGICIGSSTQLNAGGGYVSYAWSTGETSQTIFVNTAETFSVTVTDINGCVGSTSVTTTTEGSIPDPPGPISGPTEGICGVNGIVYSIDPVPNATFYVWTVPPGASIASPDDGTSITVNFDNSFTSGNIVVAAVNACGQSPAIDPTFITVNGILGIPGPIYGPSEGFCQETNVTYWIDPIPGAQTYTWSVSGGAIIIEGQGTASVILTLGSSSGTVCVLADNACGSSIPQCLAVTVSSFTVDAGDCQYVAPYIPPLNCAKLSVETTGGNSPYSYIWLDVTGDTIGLTKSIEVCPEESMVYTVVVTDNNGCSAQDNSKVEVIDARCGKNKVWVCYEGESFCVPLNKALRILVKGGRLGNCENDPCEQDLFDRTVSVVDVNKNPIGLVHANENSARDGMHVYPNPTGDYFYVSFDKLDGKYIDLQVCHILLGQMIKTSLVDVDSRSFVVDVNDLPSGMYIIIASTKQGERWSAKLIVSR